MAEQISFPNACGFCGKPGISKCARCLDEFYCSKDHQRKDWPFHKKTCKKPAISVSLSESINKPSPSKPNVTVKVSPSKLNVTVNVGPSKPNVTVKLSPRKPNVTVKLSPSKSENNEKLSPNKLNVTVKLSPSKRVKTEKLSPTNPNVTEKFSPIGPVKTEKLSPSNPCVAGPSKPVKTENSSPSDPNVSVKATGLLNLNDASMKFIKDMNSVGLCVLDNFMGSKYGLLILQEVLNLYKKGVFRQGRTIVPTENDIYIRSDVVTWLKGNEPEADNIENLIQKISVMIDNACSMPNNGLLSRYKIQRRTRIQVACYPGRGAHYQRHVDNPQKDGRCITAVYYLNYNWDKAHGGILRAYPCFSSQFHDIEPIFDRLVVYWSDNRVPHEVLPALTRRFAVSTWYFDAYEREAYLKEKAEVNEGVKAEVNEGEKAEVNEGEKAEVNEGEKVEMNEGEMAKS